MIMKELGLQLYTIRDFMKTEEEAKAPAEAMVRIGKALGRNVRAFLTDISAPLGCAVGNALEVIEAINCLNKK